MLYLWELFVVVHNFLKTVDSTQITPVKLLSSKKKRKQKETKEAMPPGTMKVDIERDYVEQAHTNITKLEEFNRQIFELKLKVIEGNVEAGTPMHALLHERMDQLQKQVDKLVQVGKGIERDEWSAKRARVSSELSD